MCSSQLFGSFWPVLALSQVPFSARTNALPLNHTAALPNGCRPCALLVNTALLLSVRTRARPSRLLLEVSPSSVCLAVVSATSTQSCVFPCRQSRKVLWRCFDNHVSDLAVRVYRVCFERLLSRCDVSDVQSTGACAMFNP